MVGQEESCMKTALCTATKYTRLYSRQLRLSEFFRSHTLVLETQVGSDDSNFYIDTVEIN